MGNTTKFYIGPEVEKTPAYGKRTLFITDVVENSKVEQYVRDNRIQHISIEVSEGNLDNKFSDLVTYLLDRNYFVTFKYPADSHAGVLETFSPGVWQSRLFVPVLRVNVKSIETSNPNLTLSLRDETIGLWSLHYNDLLDSNRFTDDSEHERVEIIENTVAPAVTKPVVKDIKVQEPVVEEQRVEPAVNNTELGLDVTPTTALKEEPSEEVVNQPDAEVKTPEDAAAAYAEGTKTDPLAPETSKKPKAKK